MENTKIFEMADRLKTLQEQKKDLEAQTKALGAEIAELDEQLSDAMTEAELDRFSRNGITFYLKSRLFASPASDRKDEMMQALKDNNIDVIGKKMTIVGAGGAATAIEIQAALDGVAEIVIFNRKDEFWDRAVSTVEKINTKTSCHAVLYDLADLDKLKAEMDDSYIFVNATGVGMKPLEGQSVVPDKSYFRPELIVVDVPYSPLETAMRSMAREVGCKTMNGLGMMLFQGAAAFKLWTGKEMPIEHMKEVLGISYDD